MTYFKRRWAATLALAGMSLLSGASMADGADPLSGYWEWDTQKTRLEVPDADQLPMETRGAAEKVRKFLDVRDRRPGILVVGFLGSTCSQYFIDPSGRRVLPSSYPCRFVTEGERATVTQSDGSVQEVFFLNDGEVYAEQNIEGFTFRDYFKRLSAAP